MANSLIRIGLVFDRSLPYCRGVLPGVKRYAEAKPHWVFLTVAPDTAGLKALRTLRPAGVVAHPGHGYGRVREASFRQAIEAAGYSVRCFHERSTTPFNPRGRLWAFHR